MASNTINTIEMVTPWADYTCSNVLASITSTNKLTLLALIPFLEEWRDELSKLSDTSKNLLRGPIASSRGARILDYLLDMSAVLRSGLLALEPLTMVFRGVLSCIS